MRVSGLFVFVRPHPKMNGLHPKMILLHPKMISLHPKMIFAQGFRHKIKHSFYRKYHTLRPFPCTLK
jgi:hypothetical protein